ncbi:MAG TPA: hypothetical protein VND91_08195 [Candidatus Saccharimonadia bacterium]|nr:hypothetical protein [Candidatus Saccharimonadia bacterium]
MSRGFATPSTESMRHDAGSAEREWETESRYWRAQYLFQPYYEPGRSYDFYAPAYRIAFEAARAEPGTPFDSLAAGIRSRLERVKHHADLDWERALPAARAAWLRAERGRRTH